jgi:hypothetical protein
MIEKDAEQGLGTLFKKKSSVNLILQDHVLLEYDLN